jgi:general secretion pathway protein D
LSNVVGKQGPLAGLVQITPIEHLNSILVVSRNISYVNEMRTWIERFDRGRDVLKPRLFVYHVQSGRARDLAAVLARVFSQSGAKPGPASATDDAPLDTIPPAGTPVASLATGTVAIASRNGGPVGLPTGQGAMPAPVPGGEPGGEAAATGAGTEPNDFRITADEANNALLITATPARYAQVEAALARLDVVPLQVLLEASIAEVNVNDTFKYGVQAWFEKGALSALSSSAAASALGLSTGGLSAAYIRNDIKATLDLLSTFTKVRVISAPKIMVLNNRTASIQVGDQVPIATSSAVSTITANAPIVNTIQLYDTGIILRVTPRVNRNGLVLMELSQEVSASVPTSTSSIDSPTIQQRRVSTSVAVADGQTIAIGGLIRDSRTNSRKGIPLLKDIPGIGAAFGVDNDGLDRTELIVLISPHVIRNPADGDAATDELSAKLPLLRAQRGAHRAQ